jgi:hypothetical protein
MPMFLATVPVLPTLNGFSVRKKPTFGAAVAQSVSGREITSVKQAFPLWEFELTYEALLTQTENQVIYNQHKDYLQLEEIQTVFLACSGQYSRFYYDDPTDNSRTAQVIATADGVSPTFQIIRTLGGGSSSLSEPVGGLNATKPYQFYVNGSPTAVTLANFNRTITFASAPTAGALITGDFYFFYLCRFLTDMNDFEQFLTNLWTLRSLKFRSVKDFDGGIAGMPPT